LGIHGQNIVIFTETASPTADPVDNFPGVLAVKPHGIHLKGLPDELADHAFTP
jgi:hypothetical protein